MSYEKESPDWREERRLRAWLLAERGWKQKEIAVFLGVTEGAVSQWLRRARDQGVTGLRGRPRPGATPKLSAEQRTQLAQLLAQGPAAHGICGETWTQASVQQLIQQVFGVSYHRDHMSRLLNDIGWPLKKPAHSIVQYGGDAVRRVEDAG